VGKTGGKKKGQFYYFSSGYVGRGRGDPNEGGQGWLREADAQSAGKKTGLGVPFGSRVNEPKEAKVQKTEALGLGGEKRILSTERSQGKTTSSRSERKEKG